MHPRQSVGERLKDARDAHDWTQGDVAERARKLSQLGLSQGRISSFERGAYVPVEAAQVLARVLEVDPGWLSHGEASAAPAPKWWKGEGGSNDLEPSLGPTRKRHHPAKGRRRQA